MRKLIFFIGVSFGTSLCLFFTIGQETGERVVLTFFAAIASIAFFGAVTSIGKTRKGRRTKRRDDSLIGLGMTSDDIMENYWRDQGRPQLTSSLEADKGFHQFDTTRF